MSLIYDWRDPARRSDGGPFCQPPAHRWSFPVRTGFTPLWRVLPLRAGTNHWRSSLAEKVALPEAWEQPDLHLQGSARQREGARTCAHAHGPLEASQRPSSPRLCNFPFFFFPDFLLNILLPRTANFWQNARDSADQMVWAVAHPPQPARLVGDLASRVLSPAVLATQLGNKLNFSM